MVFGPPQQKITSLSALNTSTQDTWNVVNGSYKDSIPPTAFPAFVDIRDVALAHVRATEKEEAKGQRYLLIGGAYVSLTPHSFPLHRPRRVLTSCHNFFTLTPTRKMKRSSTSSHAHTQNSQTACPKSMSQRSRTTTISGSTAPRRRSSLVSSSSRSRRASRIRRISWC